MGERRPLTSRDAAWAKATASWLARRRVPPNGISLFSVVAAAGAAAQRQRPHRVGGHAALAVGAGAVAAEGAEFLLQRLVVGGAAADLVLHLAELELPLPQLRLDERAVVGAAAGGSRQDRRAEDARHRRPHGATPFARL